MTTYGARHLSYMKGFPTTMEEDMELLEGEQASDRFKLAVEFRLRKKAILRHMLS